MIDLPGEQLIDWGGALRWLKSTADDNQIHRIARNAGGHATRFSAGDGGLPRYRLLYSAITSSLNSSSTLAACLTPVACTRNFEEQAMQTRLTEEMRQNARAGSRQHPARLCSLRILYRNLPNLSASGR